MNITLIGMAAVGKTSVGKELAHRLGYKFVDVDVVIEEETGKKLQQIIDSVGEKGFLEIEENTVLNLGHPHNCVISPGGSIIYSAKAMAFLKEISIVVFLHTPFPGIRKRLLNEEVRGIVGLKRKTLKELFEERLDSYKKYADVTIDLPDEKLDTPSVAVAIINRVSGNPSKHAQDNSAE